MHICTLSYNLFGVNIRIFALLVALYCGYQYWVFRPIHRPPGVMVTGIPVQKLLPEDTPSIRLQDVLIKKLADYSLKARVLSTEKYWLGQTAKIAPIDVAVGWNQMSDSAVLDKLNISQSDRFYFYNWSNRNDVDPDGIMKNSANMHLIAANKSIEHKIKKLRVGHIVSLKGQLVRVDFKDGSEMRSSLTRDDSGAGACEVMLVTALDMQ